MGQVSSSPNYQHSTTLGVFTKHCLGFGKTCHMILLLSSQSSMKRDFSPDILLSPYMFFPLCAGDVYFPSSFFILWLDSCDLVLQYHFLFTSRDIINYVLSYRSFIFEVLRCHAHCIAIVFYFYQPKNSPRMSLKIRVDG